MHLVYSLHTGGLENGVVNLCNRITPERFEPSVCVFLEGGALESRLEQGRIALTAVRPDASIDPTMPLRLASLLRRHHIDVLHTHSWGTLVEGVLAAKMARTPWVIHGEHGVMEERPRNVPIQRWLWSRVNQVTAVAEPLADRMASVVGYPRDRICVIPNGVDTERFQPQRTDVTALRREFTLPADGLLIGTVARLVPVKNHLGVVRATAELRARNIPAVLALAGEGPLREAIESEASKLGIAQHVHLLGNISQVERFLNALDIFVLNSNSEGMSNTMLEAMACGLPVVATSVGSNTSLAVNEESAVFVPAENDTALVETLWKLATNPTVCRELGEAARKRIEAEFSIARMVHDYESLYLRSRQS